MRIISQICLSGKMNNEIYTLEKMIRKPDRGYFEKAVYEEIKAMSDSDI